MKCPEDTELGHPFEGPRRDKEKAEEVSLWRKTQKDRRTSKESYIKDRSRSHRKTSFPISCKIPRGLAILCFLP